MFQDCYGDCSYDCNIQPDCSHFRSLWPVSHSPYVQTLRLPFHNNNRLHFNGSLCEIYHCVPAGVLWDVTVHLSHFSGSLQKSVCSVQHSNTSATNANKPDFRCLSLSIVFWKENARAIRTCTCRSSRIKSNKVQYRQIYNKATLSLCNSVLRGSIVF